MSHTTTETELRKLIERITSDLLRGIKHGHFDYQLTCSGNSNGTRNINFMAGLSHRFTMQLEDLPDYVLSEVTFQPKAQTSNNITPSTPEKGACVSKDKPYEPTTG